MAHLADRAEPMADAQRIAVEEMSQIGEVRRRVAELTHHLGFSSTAAGNASIVATELAGNLVHHTPGGEVVLLSGHHSTDRPQLDIWSIDRGPGMNDLGRCLTDGYSTRGGPGTGLGAVRRLADEFDAYTSAAGSVIFARLYHSVNDVRHVPFQIGGFNLPIAGEMVSGDGWAVGAHRGGMTVLLADGLGHGPLAAEATRHITDAFVGGYADDLSALMLRLDLAGAGTRGAAVALVRLDMNARTIEHVGVGNISVSLRSPSERSAGLASLPGIVGGKIRKVQQMDRAIGDDAIVILHSDGLQTRWTLDHYPGVHARHPGVIAGLLYRDYSRERDDITVIVINPRSPSTVR